MVSPKTTILFLVVSTSNIFYTITDLNGRVIYWTSVGKYKIKGTKKLTTTSLLNSINKILNFLQLLNCFYIHVHFKGTKKNKKLVLKYLKLNFFTILSICDSTSLAHNGCRLKKIRRL
uniref:Ribosomal protein S11 n=1 Tax=Gastroclonium compressum TaxID=1852973 RepID=A0A173FZQ4_GASCM|nr:ribosomal protein S11 [Coeloseira compressa]